MDSTPEFINHYINQLINEQSIIELRQLAKDYAQEKKAIDTPERRIGDNRYYQLWKKENPYSIQRDLIALDERYKSQAKEIVAEHAKKEGVLFKEWKDLEPEKNVDQKSKETAASLDNTQEKMTQLANEFQSKEQAEALAKTQVDLERQKQLEALKKQWTKNKDQMRDHDR